jgi:Mg2+ and Co2+ transporter CorA
MLRTEYRFSLEHWPQRLLAFLLGEAFLGFLAIIALALVLFPMLFGLSPGTRAAIDTLQWAIIGWFALEYVFAFVSAPHKAAFLRNVWRWIDLATVVIPLAALLPSVSRALLSSPALRLVRLARLVTLGVRVSGLTARHRLSGPVDRKTSAPAQVTLMADAPEFSPAPAAWDELIRWLRAPGKEWYHLAYPSRDQLAEIGRVAALPADFLEAHLLNTSYPHLAVAKKFSGVFLWLPEMNGDSQVDRHGLLFLMAGESVLSLSRRPTQLVERISGPALSPEEEAEKMPFSIHMLRLVLQQVIVQNERLVGSLEEQLHALEDMPVRESRPAFFEQSFRLKKDLSAAQADLWRLKGVIADLAAGRVFPLKSDDLGEMLRRLATDAEYLYETVVNVRDDVLSVIELHLNIVSFDMNRVMRVLAVVSVLGLIPAVVGGLFGMNLMDNPWPFTLPQVAFGVGFAMILGLYLFFVKGWLR